MRQKIATPTKLAAITLSAILLFGCDDDTEAETDTTTETETETESSFPDTVDEYTFSSATSPFENSGDLGTTDLDKNGDQIITATTNYNGDENTAINIDQGDAGTSVNGRLDYKAVTANVDVGSLTESFSLEAVIKVSSRVAEDDIYIMGFAETVDSGYYGGFRMLLKKDGSNKVIFRLYGTNSIDSTNHDYKLESATSLTVDNWQHVMTTYNDETDTASVYINGVLSNSVQLEASQNLSYVVNPNKTDTFRVLGGSHSDSHSNDGNFDGDVDNIATWKVALTADQVSERAEKFGF